MGSVFPREKAGVESVPCNTFTASTGLLKAGARLSCRISGLSAACADRSPTNVDPMAASPEVLRKFLLLGPVPFSFTISANLPLFAVLRGTSNHRLESIHNLIDDTSGLKPN